MTFNNPNGMGLVNIQAIWTSQAIQFKILPTNLPQEQSIKVVFKVKLHRLQAKISKWLLEWDHPSKENEYKDAILGRLPG